MTRKSRKSADLRYRLYFWLMDVCLIFAGIGLAEHLIDRFSGVEGFGMPGIAFEILTVVVLFFNFVVPLILMVAWPMRDEYAEQLWRRSVVVLAYVVAVVPFIITWSVFFAHTPGAEDQGPVLQPFFNKQWFITFMTRTWMVYMLLFVGIFQFLRWRDSR